MDVSTAVIVVTSVVLVYALAGVVIWTTIQSHVSCVAEINKAWEGALRSHDEAWARIVQERKIHSLDRQGNEQWFVALADQVSKQSEHSTKLTQAVVTLWEKGK